MRFWDTSALIPVVIREAATHEMRAFLAGSNEPPVVWTLSSVEAQSAIARRRREGNLNAAQSRRIHEALREIWLASTVVKDVEAVKEVASRLINVHDLRAADACQVAAAIVAVGRRPSAHTFACLDERLREAASAEGFDVFPPEPIAG